jgi:DNA-binding NarL/FixJ family response regulator
MAFTDKHDVVSLAKERARRLTAAPSHDVALNLRVVIADEHVLETAGLAMLLSDLCDIIGTIDEHHAIVGEVARLQPDVVITGLSKHPVTGLDTVRELRAKCSHVRIIVVTVWPDAAIAAEAFKCGVTAYILKTSPFSELRAALHAAATGKRYLTPTRACVTSRSLAARPDGESARSLTPRQREVVRLLAEGKSMKEAGALLNLSPRTIAFHKQRAMQNLKLDTTAALVRYAVTRRIVASTLE